MTDYPKSSSRRGIIRKLTVILLAGVVFSIAAIAAFIVFFPRYVSSDSFRTLLERRIGESLNTSVEINALDLIWSEGIALKGFSIKDDPSYSSSPLLSITSARLSFSYRELLRLQPRLELIVDGLEFRMIRSADGKTNIEKLFSEAAPPSPEPQGEDTKKSKGAVPQKKSRPSPIPVDIRARVLLENMTFLFEDRMENRHMSLTHARVDLDAPSVISSPVTLKIFSELSLTGHPLDPLTVEAQAAGVIGSDKTPDIRNVRINATGLLPGIQFNISGKVSEGEGVLAEMTLDLSRLTENFGFFLPPSVAGSEVSGVITLNAKASGIPPHAIDADITVSGKKIKASGKMAGDKTLGPAGFVLMNQARFDPEAGVLVIQKGALELLGRSRMSWHGELSGLNTDKREVKFHLDPSSLDLKEIFDLAGPYLPENVSVRFLTDTGFPVLELKHAGFSGPLSSGSPALSVESLSVTVPSLHLIQKTLPSSSPQTCASQTEILVSNASLQLESLTATLHDFFPKTLSLKAGADIGELTVKGAGEVKVKDVKLKDLFVRSDALSKNDAALFGVSAALTLGEALSIGQISIPGSITAADIKHSLAASCDLPAIPQAELSLSQFTLTLPSIDVDPKTLTDSGMPSGPELKVSARCDSAVSSIRIRGMEPVLVDIAGATSQIDVGEFLKITIDANAKELASAAFDTTGSVSVDLSRLFDKFRSVLPENIRMTGGAGAKWSIAGRLPREMEIEKLKSLSIDPKKELSFLRALALEVGLNDMGLSLAVNGENYLRFDSVSTLPPLRYAFNPATGNGSLTGSVIMNDLSGSAFRSLSHPLQATLTIAGRHEGLNRLSLAQTLDIPALTLTGKVDASIYGIDRFLKTGLKTPVGQALKTLGGAVKGKLGVSDGSSLAMFLDGGGMKGSLDAGVEVKLIPGQSVGGNVRVDIPETDIRMGNLFELKHLKTAIDLGKNYRILSKNLENEGIVKRIPLSAQVMMKGGVPVKGLNAEFQGAFQPEAGTDEPSTRRFLSEIENRFHPTHTLSFDAARLTSGPLLIDIHETILDFTLDKGLPGFEFFQVSLLGGTVMGSVLTGKGKSGFAVEMNVNFSGIDTARLAPDAKSASGNPDAELSGRLSASIPLSPELPVFLSQMGFDLEFTHIGSQVIERVLYALDPSESNETIVSQRKLLRKGSPKWIKVSVKDGNLSVSGEVVVVGLTQALPKLERLNIVNLTALRQYEEALAAVTPIVDILTILSATEINIGEDGSHLKFETAKRIP